VSDQLGTYRRRASIHREKIDRRPPSHRDGHCRRPTHSRVQRRQRQRDRVEPLGRVPATITERSAASARTGWHSGPFARRASSKGGGTALTLRQALSVLWQQRFLILAAVILAAAAASFYLHSESPSYSSTASVALTNSTTQGATSTTGANLQLVTGVDVSDAAAKALGGDPRTLVSEVSAAYNSTNNVVDSTATTSTESQADQSQNAIAALQSQVDKIQAQIASLSTGGNADSAVVKSQLASLNTLYQTTFTQLTAATVAPAPSTLLQAAEDGVSTASSKSKILGLGLLIGLLAGAGIALIREPFDTRIRNVDEAEEASGLPTLAQLPFTRAYRRGSHVLAVVTEPRTPFAESIRELRTSVQVLLGSASTPVLVVTSPAPFDGKTIITANLASSYALAGKLTILVSGDLRRPRIHEFFGGSEADEGLAELVTGAAPTSDDVSRLLQETSIDGMYFLPPGQPSGDPADALASPAMVQVLNHLRALADIVLIDAPPVLAAADAAIIATHADGTVLIVRNARTQRSALAETMKRLVSARVTVLGLALNRVKKITGAAYQDHYQTVTRMMAPDDTRPIPRSDVPQSAELADIDEGSPVDVGVVGPEPDDAPFLEPVDTPETETPPAVTKAQSRGTSPAQRAATRRRVERAAPGKHHRRL
jgi:succinoglycan biosynthesis transport protein ExoP